MSGFLGNVFSLFSHSGAKTDRKKTLEGYGDLSNVFNFGMNQAKTSQAAGGDLLGQAGGYYSKLLSGDRAATMQAVAPVANVATSQADAAKRGLAESGTARGGGVNAASQQMDTNTRASIDTAVNQARAGAAKGATEVGGTMTSDAARLLGIGSEAAATLTDESRRSRSESDRMHQEKAKQYADFATSVLDVAFGA